MDYNKDPHVGSTLRRAAIDGLVWGISGKVALVVANLAALMVTSRLLSADEFGVFAAATIFTDMSWALATSTFGVALVRQADLTPQDQDAGYYAFLGLGLGLAMIFVAGSALAESSLNAPGLRHVLWALALVVPAKLMSGYGGAILQRRLDMRYYQLTQNLPQIVGGAGVTIAAALNDLGVWSLVAGFATATLLEFMMIVARVRMLPCGPPNVHAILATTRIGAPTAVNRLLNFAGSNVDRVVVSTLLGAATLGLYTRAYNLMMTPVKLLGLAVSRVFLPIFSRMQAEPGRIGLALQRVLCAQAIVFGPLSMGFVITAPLLVHIILGKQWEETVPLAQVFFLVLFARLGYIACEAASIASGRAWRAAQRQGIYAFAVAVLASVGATWGAVGAASGAAVGLIVFYVLSLRHAVKCFDCKSSVLLLAHGRGLSLSLLAALMAWGMSTSFERALPRSIADLQFIEVVVYWPLIGAMLTFSPKSICGSEFYELRSELLRPVIWLLGRIGAFLTKSL